MSLKGPPACLHPLTVLIGFCRVVENLKKDFKKRFYMRKSISWYTCIFTGSVQGLDFLGLNRTEPNLTITSAPIFATYHYSVPPQTISHTWPIAQYTGTYNIKTLLLPGNTSHMYQVTMFETLKSKAEFGYDEPRQCYQQETLMDHSCRCHNI
jgi:hypothetical protein